MKRVAKMRWFLYSLSVLILLLGFCGCNETVSPITGGNTSDVNANANTDTNDGTSGKTEIKTSGSWVKVIEFSGTEAVGKSDVFTLSGGDIRVTYTIETTTQNQSIDSGTSFIYILKKGYTRTENDKGNMELSLFDASAVGSKVNETKTVTKAAGEYYIDINTSSVKSYKITIEEEVAGEITPDEMLPDAEGSGETTSGSKDTEVQKVNT